MEHSENDSSGDVDINWKLNVLPVTLCITNIPERFQSVICM